MSMQVLFRLNAAKYSPLNVLANTQWTPLCIQPLKETVPWLNLTLGRCLDLYVPCIVCTIAAPFRETVGKTLSHTITSTSSVKCLLERNGTAEQMST